MQESLPIADLHCDLLSFLQGHPERNAFDAEALCSLPQLQKGNVRWQTFAIFTRTGKDSSRAGMRQSEIFKSLALDFSKHQITPFAAIENASGFCDENESLQEGLKRLDEIEKNCGALLYITLTWKEENRFGGGDTTQAGLKEDGRTLLKYLDRKKIAVDLAHASERLAEQVLSHIDKNNLKIPLIVSHTGFRTLCDTPRNVSDTVAKEVIRRRGLIGLSWIRSMIGGNGFESFCRHVEYGLKLGGEKNCCFGADFFYSGDLPAQYRNTNTFFFEGFENASQYPSALKTLQKELRCSEETLKNFTHNNFSRWLKR